MRESLAVISSFYPNNPGRWNVRWSAVGRWTTERFFHYKRGTEKEKVPRSLEGKNVNSLFPPLQAIIERTEEREPLRGEKKCTRGAF